MHSKTEGKRNRQGEGSRRVSHSVDRRLKFEALISDISARLLKALHSEVDQEIERALQKILEFFRVDRCGLLQTSGERKTWMIAFAAYAEGVPMAPEKTELPMSLYPWVSRRLMERQEVNLFKTVDELPAEAGIDKQTYREWGIKSCMDIPILMGGHTDYVLAINATSRECAWPEDYIPRLRLLGETFVNALERRHMQDQLRVVAEEWDKTFNTMQDIIMIMDREFRIMQLNDAAIKFFDLPKEKIIGIPCYTLMHGTEGPIDGCPYKKMMDTKNHEETEIYDELRGKWFRVVVDPHLDKMGGVIGVVHTVKDITDRKDADSALRSSQRDLQRLAGRLISAQEEELRRLSRELHDDLTQRLAVLAIEAGKLELGLRKTPEVSAETLQNLLSVKDELIKISEDVHNIARQLHPTILDDLGLVRAIESKCAMLMKREEINIAFQDADLPSAIPKDTALCLFRIVQEGLMNVIRHSRAGGAEIFLRSSGSSICLTIRDAGIGFDPAEVRHQPGLGLASMRERVGLVGGDFSIQSQPGQGTVINVSVPLKAGGA